MVILRSQAGSHGPAAPRIRAVPKNPEKSAHGRYLHAAVSRDDPYDFHGKLKATAMDASHFTGAA
jgi:hypothetical protein